MKKFIFLLSFFPASLWGAFKTDYLTATASATVIGATRLGPSDLSATLRLNPVSYSFNWDSNNGGQLGSISLQPGSLSFGLTSGQVFYAQDPIFGATLNSAENHEFFKSIYLGGVSGNMGQVLTSQGDGVAPAWTTISGFTPNSTFYIQNTLTPNTTTQSFSVQYASITERFQIQMSTSNSITPLIIKATGTSSTNDLTQWQNSTGTVFARITGSQEFSNVGKAGLGINHNEIFGDGAGRSLTIDAIRNTFLGMQAGKDATTASYNTCVGWQACLGMSLGSENTVIGHSATVSNSVAQATVIGSNATVTATSGVAIGKGNSSDGGVVIGANCTGGIINIGTSNTVSNFGSMAFGSANVISNSDNIFFGTGMTSDRNGEARFSSRQGGDMRIGVSAVSSTVADRKLFFLDGSFIDNTDATRKARVSIGVYDTAKREAIQINTNGTVPYSIVTGSLTVNDRVDAATFSVRGTNLFTSTINVTSMNGYVLYLATGPVAANTSVTISTTNMGIAELGIPICSEIETVNTIQVSVRVKSLALPNSFVVYNADALNAKEYVCYVTGRPL